MLGIGAYSNTSNIVNSEVRQFKGLQDEIAIENKQLQAQAGQKADLDDLRNIGQEMGIKQGKDLLEKYGKKLYRGKIPFTETSIKELDQKAGSFVEDKINTAIEQGKNYMGEIQGSFGRQKANMSFSDRLNNGVEMPELGEKEIGEIPEIANQSEVTATINNQASRITSIEELSQPPATQPPVETEINPRVRLGTGSGEADLETIAEFKNNPAENSISTDVGKFEDHLNSKYGSFSSGAETEGKAIAQGVQDAGEQAGTDLAAAASDVAGVETGEAVAQTAGLALDATGILAPLGGLISLGADIFALFEAGKTADDFVEREITKTKPEPQASLIPQPTAPLTLAQKGFGVTPSLDTYDIAHTSISSRW
jgi:hypothetical protein